MRRAGARDDVALATATSARSTACIGTVGSNAGCSAALESGRAGATTASAGAVGRAATTASRSTAVRVLDGDLAPVRAAASSSVVRGAARPARARLEQRERDGVLAAAQLREAGGRDRVAHRGAREVRHRREVRAEGAGDQAQLDRAEPVVAHRPRARRTRPAPPQRVARSAVAAAAPRARAATRGRAASRRASLSQVCSSLSSRSMSYSCGQARTRSAMMLRWICCVPP